MRSRPTLRGYTIRTYRRNRIEILRTAIMDSTVRRGSHGSIGGPGYRGLTIGGGRVGSGCHGTIVRAKDVHGARHAPAVPVEVRRAGCYRADEERRAQRGVA